MRAPSWFGIAIILWLAGELAAFALLVHVAGWSGAILLGVLTSLAGVFMLRQTGVGAARGLRRAVNGEDVAEGAMLDGTLAALGAVLLILPGFLSGAVHSPIPGHALRRQGGAGQIAARRRDRTVARGLAARRRPPGASRQSAASRMRRFL
jgi:UPF0716 protein FxsA